MDSDALAAAMLKLLADASRGRTLNAVEIAHAIRPDGDWHALIAPIRRCAIDLAQRGQLVLYRKGKPIDPATLKGVYRIGLPRHD